MGKWVTVPEDEFGLGLAKMVGLTQKDYPEVVLWEFGKTSSKDKVFRLSQQDSGNDLTEPNLKAFVEKWQSGGLSKKTGTTTTKTTTGATSDKHQTSADAKPKSGTDTEAP